MLVRREGHVVTFFNFLRPGSWSFIVVLIALRSTSLGADFGIRVPDGFEVTKFAGDELAHDIYSITTDARGRIAVAGGGYVKILEDADSDGQAEHAHLYSSKPASGAHGMYFDGADLICTGDNQVMRLIDSDGDGTADKQVKWTELAHPEHGANGVIKGPDGWYYIVCGNDAGVSKKHATTKASPIHDPIQGAIVRLSPDGKQSEIIADGFRNPYGIDFNATGHLFTVDSDNERDEHLPWYCPTRLFDVSIGQSHGWVAKGWQQGWNRPQYYPDSVERLVEIGRGSPTGLLVYRHRTFPARYREGVFSACWSLGRIYFLPIKPHGASYQGDKEIFLEGTGSTGLAIVGMTIDPKGDMYFAVGGRKTQGSVYRIRYTGPRDAAISNADAAMSELVKKHGREIADVLTADQPLSSWSRARWVPAAQKLGAAPFEQVVIDRSLSAGMRIRAIEVLTELFGGLPKRLDVPRFAPEEDAIVVARVAWSLGRFLHKELFEDLQRLARHRSIKASRAAWEALLSFEQKDGQRIECLSERAHDSRIRAAMIKAYQRHGRKPYVEPPARKDDPFFDPGPCDLIVDRLIAQPKIPQAIEQFKPEVHSIRAVVRALGDIPNYSIKPEVFVGYSVANAAAVKTVPGNRLQGFARYFPASPELPPELRGIELRRDELNPELARLLAIVECPDHELPAKIVAMFSHKTSLENDVHYLIVLARLPAERSSEVTRQTARALVLLHHKLAARGDIASRNWPLRVGEMFDELCNKDPALAEAVVADEKFGLPDHSLFVGRMTGDVQKRAARKLLAAVTANQEAEWTTDLLEALKVLPVGELRPHLREHWDNPALRDAIAVQLAAEPLDEDRERLVEALSSVQPKVVEQVAQGLARLTGKATPQEIGAAIAALRQQCLAPNERAARKALVSLLTYWTGQQFSIVEQKDDLAAYAPWFDWFANTYPDESKRLRSFSGDLASWQERLAKVEWDTGHAARGKAVFEKRACHRCHAEAGRLGPDLVGTATRFSREDLFATIVDPNKDVAPLYQTTSVVTDDGQVYNGLVVYESPETTLLQTGPDSVVRLTNVRKDAMQKSPQSLMPTGLLNEASDQELADLYAYLKSLSK